MENPFKKSEEVVEPQSSANIGLNAAQLQELITSIVREVKKPNEFEQMKIDDEKRKLTERRKQVFDSIMAEDEKRKRISANCPHTKEDGAHAWRAQVNADGYFRPMCVMCSTTLAPIKATADQMANGLSLQRLPNLTRQILEAEAARCVPPPLSEPQKALNARLAAKAQPVGA